MKNKRVELPEHTPLHSIRLCCMECCDGNPHEVRACPVVECPLHPYRLRKKTIPGSLLKAINKRCRDCGEGTAQAVRKCEFSDCPIFHYRNGTSPAHKLAWAGKHPKGGFKKGHSPCIKKTCKKGLKK
jgi:hypothetical protein